MNTAKNTEIKRASKMMRVSHYLKDVLIGDVPVLLCTKPDEEIIGDRVTIKKKDVTCPECLELLEAMSK